MYMSYNYNQKCYWTSLIHSSSGVFRHLDCGIRSLKQLDILMKGLQGDIPGDGIGNLTQLVHLDMSLNRFNGSIPNQIFSLTSLGYLDMSENLLEGKLGPELKFCGELICWENEDI
nr:leucine-rich repeat-containing protein [Tanacetum cinerariifolium]